MASQKKSQTRNFEYLSRGDIDMPQGKDFAQTLRLLSEYGEQNPQQSNKLKLDNQTAGRVTITGLNIADKMFISDSFDTATLSNCVFSGCTFKECTFKSCNLYNVKFADGCVFSGCSFDNAKMMDVDASGSSKKFCTFAGVDFGNNVTGFSQEDASVVEDDVNEQEGDDAQDGVLKQQFKPENDVDLPQAEADGDQWKSAALVDECMKKDFPLWREQQRHVYQLYSDDDQNTGFAVYPNPQKDGQVWQTIFFFAGVSLYMADFDASDMTADDIKQQVQDFMQVCRGDMGGTLVERMITIMENKEL